MIDLVKRNIIELQQREKLFPLLLPDDSRNVNYISISQFINDNYNKKYLFYSINHPTKFLFHYQTDKILECLSIEKMEYPPSLDPLNIADGFLYKQISKLINYEKDHNKFIIYGVPYNFKQTISWYINVYKNENYDILKNICIKDKII